MITKTNKARMLSKSTVKKSIKGSDKTALKQSGGKVEQKANESNKKNDKTKSTSGDSKERKTVSKRPPAKQSLVKKDSKPAKSLIPRQKSAKKKNVKPEKESLTKRERRSLKIDAKKNPETVRYLLSKWEILRRDDTDKERKYELVDQMLKNCNKSLSEFCFAHDTSRIIESMIQFGNERQKYEMFNYLKPKLMEMSESHFGRFVVKKLISYCAKDQISDLIKLVSGNVAKLLVHKYSCEIVELLFNDHANAKQRSQMLQELYGNRDLLGLNDITTTITLEDVINQNNDKRQAILSNVNSVLVKLVAKNLTSMSIIQRLILEYLTCEIPFLRSMLPANIKTNSNVERASDFKLPERLQTLLDAFIEHSQLVPMLHTREGVRVALCLLWVSGPKTKKGLLKSLKTAICSIATNENGHLFVIGLLDFVDDVVLLEKTVIKELLEDLEVIVTHPYGRKVLLYSLTPRNNLHFTKQVLQSFLLPGDISPFTKKPLGIRAFELRSFSLGLLPALLRLASEKLVTLFVGDRVEHFKPILDRGRLVLLTEIIMQSSPKALTPQYCMETFVRSVNSNQEKCNLSELTTAELNSMTQLRKQVLSDFVRLCLCPEFIPTGKSFPKSSEEKEANQLKRRKKALALAEEESIKRRKITVPAFSNMDKKKSTRLDDEEEQDEPMDVDEQDGNKGQVELTEEDEILLEMPWLERPEATPILNRLIDNCKSSRCFDLCDSIMELVNPAVMRSWVNCNRSCFFIVKLLELDYKPMCEFITKTVSNPKFIAALNGSNLKAAEILFKKLN
ncbi:hypothetical protein Ciccas_001779 [Cichlidogyrus casuarinus]|uniref:PUM-HD domain-containing protein n=1 Tax=Cichlidogyrus casuarinus TaxID=1844966 RepID=A0ABD2QJ63_9PLAT